MQIGIIAWSQGVKTAEGWFLPRIQDQRIADDRSRGSLSWRNRNPGNLECEGDKGEKNGVYAVFSTMDVGMMALQRLLMEYVEKHPTWTLREATNYYINGKTESIKQNSDSYLKTVISVCSPLLGTDAITPETSIQTIATMTATRQ
jgi:hypothetical protein